MSENKENIFTRMQMVMASLSILVLLTGCATATRGGSTMFIVETSPVGARVETSVPIKGTPKLSNIQIKKIKLGKMDEPKFTYRYCEPTPCGIEIPRKLKLDILITKDGYIPQIHSIDFLHRKEIAKQTARNTAIAAGGTAVAGGVIGGGMATMFGGAVTAGPVIGGAAMLAGPVVLVGLISGGVDASTSANYDYWPNPALANLVAMNNEETEKEEKQTIIQQFAAIQRNAKLTPELSNEEKRENYKKKTEQQRKAKRAARKAKKQQEKTSK